MTTSAASARSLFNLRWQNHNDTILQVFLEQLANENLVDVTLSCEGKFLKVHRMILFACSPYFQNLFLHIKEQNPIIILNGLKYAAVKSIVDYMYSGEMEVTEAEIAGVMAVAEALDIKGLSSLRGRFEPTRMPSHSEEVDDGGGNQEDRCETGKSGSCQGGPLSKKRKICEGSQKANPAGKNNNNVENSYIPEAPNLPPESDEVHRKSCSSNGHENSKNSGGEIVKTRSENPDWKLIKDAERSLSPTASPTVLNELRSPSGRNAADNHKVAHSEMTHARYSLSEPLSSNTVLQIDNEGVSSVSSLALERTARKTAGNKIPRPTNAFMVFANKWRQKLAKVHSNETNKDISVRLGAMWKELPPDEKEIYFAEARKVDQEHKLRYPGYTYSPKEARMRKILRRVAVKPQAPQSALREAAQKLPLTSIQETQQS